MPVLWADEEESKVIFHNICLSVAVVCGLIEFMVIFRRYDTLDGFKAFYILAALLAIATR